MAFVEIKEDVFININYVIKIEKDELGFIVVMYDGTQYTVTQEPYLSNIRPTKNLKPTDNVHT